MKIKDILVFVILMAFFYLIGSFNALSFNPFEWSSFGRYAYSCMGTILAIAGTAAFRFMKS